MDWEYGTEGCNKMPYVNWEGHIEETRRERQMREQTQRLAKKASKIKATGLMAAFSVSSLLLAGFSNSTEAMLTTSLSDNLPFGAANHFPGWYSELNSELQNIVVQENAIVQQMQAQNEIYITGTELLSIQQSIQQLDRLETSAAQTFQQINQAAQNDENSYLLARINPANSQAIIDSYARVAAIGKQALNVAQSLYGFAQNDQQTGANILAIVNRACQAGRSLLGPTVSQTVYGQSVPISIYGGSGVEPSISSSVSSNPHSGTVLQSVYEQVYATVSSSSSITLGPNTGS